MSLLYVSASYCSDDTEKMRVFLGVDETIVGQVLSCGVGIIQVIIWIMSFGDRTYI